jgi:hypothetical protein
MKTVPTMMKTEILTNRGNLGSPLPPPNNRYMNFGGRVCLWVVGICYRNFEGKGLFMGCRFLLQEFWGEGFVYGL